MAKEKFERTNRMLTSVQSVTLTMVKLLWLLQSQRYWLKKAKLTSKITAWSIKLQKNVNVVSQSTLHTLNTKLKTVTMHTLTAQAMLTMLKIWSLVRLKWTALSWYVPQLRPYASNSRTHLVGSPSWCSCNRSILEQSWHGWRRRIDRISRNWKFRELLSSYEFPGDEVPIVVGSALKALEGDAQYVAKIDELMAAVDSYIPTPVRDTDKPFLMPVEDVFTITGRGTVATGRCWTWSSKRWRYYRSSRLESKKLNNT